MVLFKADEMHFAFSMKAMSKLRRDQSFCDVRLIVGHNKVHAHKCVLAAGSPYFSSLFLGKFTEAMKDEINLSEVTDSIEALELIIDFVYTGEIDIDANNLGTIVKLSSFFLIDSLRFFCITFMMESLTLKTCLKYYIHSMDYGLPDIDIRTARMVHARFHDCLIFQEESVHISPDEMLLLVNENMLDHCSSSNLLQFIVEWIIYGLTERHLSIGTELLDIMNSKGHNLFLNYTEATETALEGCQERVQVCLAKISVGGKDKFLRRFRQILTKASFHKHLERKNYDLRVPSSPRSKLVSESKLKAVLSLVPRPHTVEAFEKKRAGLGFQTHSIRKGEPIMDLFAYAPETKFWFHIAEFRENVDTINYLADEMLWGLWCMGISKDELVLLNCGLEEMSLYSMKTKSWRQIHFNEQIENLLKPSEYCNDYCFTAGADGSMYLIGKVTVIADDDLPSGINFKGFKLDPVSANWHQIFQTENFDMPDFDYDLPEMHAKVSTVSNELLLTYATKDNLTEMGLNVAVVVNLKDSNLQTSCVKLFFTFQNKETMAFRGINIMEGKAQFFIMSNGTCTSDGKVQVKFEYKYRSNCLIEINSNEKVISVMNPDFHEFRMTENDGYPCWSEVTTVDKDTLWYLEGNLDKVSALTEVTLNRSKSPVIKGHPPPPFSCVTALWAGNISADILENRVPVSHFPYVD